LAITVEVARLKMAAIQDNAHGGGHTPFILKQPLALVEGARGCGDAALLQQRGDWNSTGIRPEFDQRVW